MRPRSFARPSTNAICRTGWTSSIGTPSATTFARPSKPACCRWRRLRLEPGTPSDGMSLTLQTLVLLLIVIAAVDVAKARLRIPSAILLVVTGVVLALVPGVPDMELAPELVLLLVVPPLIYSAAVGMSWREFRRNLRPIALLAVGCVAFT